MKNLIIKLIISKYNIIIHNIYNKFKFINSFLRNLCKTETEIYIIIKFLSMKIFEFFCIFLKILFKNNCHK